MHACGCFFSLLALLVCRVTYKDGQMEGEPRPCAAVKGTQITVENLFYNVAARRKAFKNPSEEYGRILDVVSRYAVHKIHASFSCKKHGDNRADIHTVASPSHTDAIRAVYGPGVARELISLSVSDDDPSRATFKMQGYISSANYTSKRTVMVLFINGNAIGSE
jgi:DNA mismatch repair protein MLH1